MEAEDEPVEHEIRDVVRIVVADLQRRERLPALAIDLLRRKRRTLHHLGREAEHQIDLIFDDGAADERQFIAGADADDAAGRLHEVGDRLSRFRRRALIQ